MRQSESNPKRRTQNSTTWSRTILIPFFFEKIQNEHESRFEQIKKKDIETELYNSELNA